MSELSEKDIDGSSGSTPIQQFFDGTGVLITGATGFVGKVLVEKCLRSCTGIDKIYLLMRPKKGKSIDVRLKEMFDDVLYDRVKEEQPKCISKIVPVAGDCSLLDLGLSPESRQLLQEKVHIVFHSAATIRFEENLKTAYEINTRGTRELLKLAHSMKNLKSFVYISSAYSNCHDSYIEEKVYEVPFNVSEVCQLIEKLSPEELEEKTTQIIGKWPNTYTFTKMLGEYFVKAEEGKFPVCIMRPAVVAVTSYEPIRGWTETLFGPTGIIVGAGLGVIRTFYANVDFDCNIVPADMTANVTIAAAKETNDNYKDGVKEARVYNYVSSSVNRFSIGDLMRLAKLHGLVIPTEKCIWYYFLILTKYKSLFLFLHFFLHYIPGLLMDGAALLAGKKPQMTKLYKKVNKFSDVLTYFLNQQIYFDTDNVYSLWDKLSDSEKKCFNFNMKSLDWSEYMKHYMIGLRVYFLKDDLSTVPEASRRYKKLYYLHQFCLIVFSVLFIQLVWFIVSTIFQLLS